MCIHSFIKIFTEFYRINEINNPIFTQIQRCTCNMRFFILMRLCNFIIINKFIFFYVRKYYNKVNTFYKIILYISLSIFKIHEVKFKYLI